MYLEDVLHSFLTLGRKVLKFLSYSPLVIIWKIVLIKCVHIAYMTSCSDMNDLIISSTMYGIQVIHVQPILATEQYYALHRYVTHVHSVLHTSNLVLQKFGSQYDSLTTPQAVVIEPNSCW